MVALIKPQFEAGREKVGKSGVVRDTDVHMDVLTTVLSFAEELGFRLKGLTYSPITGGEGNIEFLAYWSSNDGDSASLAAPFFDLKLYCRDGKRVTEIARKINSSLRTPLCGPEMGFFNIRENISFRVELKGSHFLNFFIKKCFLQRGEFILYVLCLGFGLSEL